MHDPSLPEREKVPGREALESLLDRALGEAGGAGEASPFDLEALRAVAGRHRDEPFALDPMAVEMVNALLRSWFKGFGPSAEAFRGMSREIARTLYEDPAGRERLERLWNHLVGTGG